MYGKHFASMYEGSMVGSGAIVFAVWGYVIASQVPDRVVGSQVRLNPKLLAAILGEKEADIAKAIGYLCEPDPQSTTPDKQGRRLVKLGQFDYQVVNGAKYRWIQNQEERRTQNREAQRRLRERKKALKNSPSQRERSYEDAIENDEDPSGFLREQPAVYKVTQEAKREPSGQ